MISSIIFKISLIYWIVLKSVLSFYVFNALRFRKKVYAYFRKIEIRVVKSVKTSVEARRKT